MPLPKKYEDTNKYSSPSVLAGWTTTTPITTHPPTTAGTKPAKNNSTSKPRAEKSKHPHVVLDIAMICNNLMIVGVATLLPPIHQAYIRSAGTAGVSIFEELMLGLKVVPMGVEVLGGVLLLPTRDSSEDRMAARQMCHFPVGTAIASKCGQPPRPLKPGTLIIHQAAMIRHNRRVPYGGWAQMVWADAHYKPTPPSNVGYTHQQMTRDGILTQLPAVGITLGGTFEAYTEVPPKLLLRCANLRTIDLSPLRNVTRIGDEFLSGCDSLREIDLSPFQNVTEIGSYFILEALSLKSFDAAPLSKVVRIGQSFLAGNTLATLDLSPMTNLVEIPSGFLCNSSCLEYLKLPTISTATTTSTTVATRSPVVRVHDNFLRNCHSLVEVDLSSLRAVTNIGSYFKAGSHSLFSIDLTPLTQVRVIGTHFMYGCAGGTSFKSIDLSALRNVATVGPYFLSNCTNLSLLDLSPFRQNLTVVGEYFAAGCVRLQTIDLSPLEALTTIQHHFMAGCAELTSVTISHVQHNKVTKVGMGFFDDCPKLLAPVDLTMFVNAQTNIM